LHTHYPQPFDKINSLLKLARVDGYQVMVSRDTVLGDLLPDTSEITNIEQGENLWMHQEMCQSVDALNEALDRRRADGRPILFFSQPMNIHQFAINNQPRLNSNWSTPGFNNRVSHEVNQVDGCFGKFVMSLKERKMYDNSIIIVTSDHGDALGEFGRSSHSLTIYPEIMRVPLLIHLPKAMKNRLVFDEEGTKMLTDLAPTLYYVLGHREIRQNPLFGRPLLVESRQEVDKYRREEWMLASDAVAVYGILGAGGRYFYAAYDSPARSYLYDLRADPQGTEDVLTPELKRKYDREIIDHLNKLADFYGYHPGLGKFFGGQ
jgi:arylsulfatase A-like enzyme